MIRKAFVEDIKEIHALLQFYGIKGELLARPLHKLYDHLRDFWVFEKDKKIIGCCALQFCWKDIAEIRSLAVKPEFKGEKIGLTLVEKAILEAKSFKIKNIFTLTYHPDFFKRFEFKIIDKKKLPIKIWSDCIGCVNFPDCDEIAMLKKL